MELNQDASFKDLEQQGWIAKASGYAAWLGEITRGAADPLLDATHVRRGTRVLDAASGPRSGSDAMANMPCIFRRCSSQRRSP